MTARLEPFVRRSFWDSLGRAQRRQDVNPTHHQETNAGAEQSPIWGNSSPLASASKVGALFRSPPRTEVVWWKSTTPPIHFITRQGVVGRDQKNMVTIRSESPSRSRNANLPLKNAFRRFTSKSVLILPCTADLLNFDQELSSVLFA